MVKLRMTSNILRWTSPGAKLSKGLQSSAAATSKHRTEESRSPGVTKRWIHDDSLLISGHVAYIVKFLGNVEVDKPKGLDTVRDSIKKLEFQEHLKRSEGEKIRRVELTISIGGVAMRDLKTKNNINQFPLHRISYCADDKSNRKYLSFISKVQENSDRHECFVFVCEKLSEEIALTIGQAFDIAWRRFLDMSGNDFDAKRELVQAKKKIRELEQKVSELEEKLKEDGRNTTVSNSDNSNRSQATIQIPPVSPPATSTTTRIDLTLATNKLQSLIDSS